MNQTNGVCQVCVDYDDLIDDLDSATMDLAVALHDRRGVPGAMLAAVVLDVRRMIARLTRHAEAMDKARRDAPRKRP